MPGTAALFSGLGPGGDILRSRTSLAVWLEELLRRLEFGAIG